MRSALALLTAIVLAGVLVSCGGSDDDSDGSPNGGSSSYTATVASADRFAIGPSRFVFLLEDARGQPVSNASLHLRFFYIDPVRDDRKTVKNEIDATPVELAKEYELTGEDGASVTLGPGPTGIYATDIAFDQAGDWIVDMTGTAGNNNLGTIEVTFLVAETASGLRVGQQTPALADGRTDGPLMLVFGTPGVCHTEVCGPLVEIAHEVETAMGGELPAEYVEPDADGEFPGWADAWGPGDEPAVFFIDEDGFLRGHLETIASFSEVEALASAVLQ